MKAFATVLIGFIAGLAISGVLGDIIVAVNNSAGRISSAWAVAKADKSAAGGNFSQAAIQYEKALVKINPENKKLTAKVKNNLALSVFNVADAAKDAEGIKKSISVFSQSLELHKELNDPESVEQTETNIKEAEAALNLLSAGV
ncbi:MAG: hypothetical protein LBR69_07600 [Endomicrobium sp.]|nr:hypothetical protein [Endomicrobium sp.]